MEEGVHSLINKLCCSLSEQVLNENPDKEKLTKRIRSRAFDVLLQNNKTLFDDEEDDPEMVLIDINGHIYSNAKERGEWCWEMKEKIDKMIIKMETLARADSTLYPVLKLLLCLANSVPSYSLRKEPSYGLDMKMLSTDTFKHQSLLKGPSSFNNNIFEFPGAFQKAGGDCSTWPRFSELPGVGLRHQDCFAIPHIESPSLSIRMEDMDLYDISNANWIFPKLSTSDHTLNNTIRASKVEIRQDEGYVTPDQDVKEDRDHGPVDYHWEQICDEEFKPVYSWESFGSFVKNKELPSIFQDRRAADHVWKIVHASNMVSNFETGRSKRTVLEELSLEELEVAFKNLLIGVQSRIFHYDSIKKTFVLKEGVYLKALSPQALEEYCKDFIECGNLFLALSLVTEDISNSSTGEYGLIYQVLCSNIKCYLQCYRGIVLNMPSLHGLLQAPYWLCKLRTQLQFLLDLLRAEKMPKGGALLAHIYDQLPLVTQADLTYLLYYILQSCTEVYFELLNRWIFEGECHRFQGELFIESCSPEEMDRRFWSRSFTLNKLLVPGFLKDLETDIFLCGKNMALLNICAPDDPVYVSVKKGYPKIAVCLNKSHIKKTEELCKIYKQRYKALFQEMFGNIVTDFCPDEDYYANLRAATLKKIYDVQEAEKKLKNEKKRIEFELLKKGMEEVESRRKEDKQKFLEEEEKLLKEAEEVDKLNKLRTEEERQKLEHYYSAMSQSADLRRERIEWKMKRVELHNKRVKFFKAAVDLGYFHNSKVLKNEANEYFVDNKGNQNSRPVLGKEIDSKTVTKDYITCKAIELQNNDQTKETNHLKTENILSEHGNDELQDKKREWMIALDVAEQARQSAAKFKERNMFNDYNILTGEIKLFKNKFCEKIGERISDHNMEKTYKEETIVSYDSESIVNISNELIESSDQRKNDTVLISDDKTVETSVDEVEKNVYDSSNGPSSTTDKIIETPVHVLEKTVVENNCDGSSKRDKKESRPLYTGEKEITPPENGLNLDEINLISVDKNLRMSVMIPLQIQLELSNEAVLRLLLTKHNLLKHLECIKKYFFLQGEFGLYLTRGLFSEIQTIVKNVQDPSYVLNVPRMNSLLRSFIGTSSDEEYTERLSFYIKKVPSVFRLIDPNMLDCLFIRYKTFWPMNIIVTDGTILKLDIVFVFLLKLHRVSWALEEAIYLLKDKRLDGSKQLKEIQLFRHIMSHFVNSLKTYIATTLEGCWIQFNEEIQKVKTLDEMYDLYVKYINQLHFRCLLNKKAQPMGTHLNNVFGQILRFYEGLRKGVWTLDAFGQFNHPNFRSLAHVYSSFLKEARYIYQYTKCSVQSDYQQQLLQLHSLLSLNEFYNTNHL